MADARGIDCGSEPGRPAPEGEAADDGTHDEPAGGPPVALAPSGLGNRVDLRQHGLAARRPRRTGGRGDGDDDCEHYEHNVHATRNLRVRRSITLREACLFARDREHAEGAAV